MDDGSSAARALENGANDGANEASYRGSERRRHRVYMTRNTEYHFRDGFCVAVRDRRTGDFLHGHLALQRRVHGGLKFFPDGAIAPNAGEPRAGESLYFAAEAATWSRAPSRPWPGRPRKSSTRTRLTSAEVSESTRSPPAMRRGADHRNWATHAGRPASRRAPPPSARNAASAC